VHSSHAQATPATEGVIDFHNHVMPGVDDGAESEDEARAALIAMRRDGCRTVIATPHVESAVTFNGAVAPDRLDELDHGWALLRNVAAELDGGGFDVRRGAEVRLSSANPDVGDARIRLDGGPFVLVEFAYFAIPPRSARLLGGLREQGWYPILAHPERYSGYGPDFSIVNEWREAGAFLQLSGPSLLGRYGSSVRRTANALLTLGAVDFMSSDYHARGEPRIADAYALLVKHGAREQADRLMHENPRRLLEGELPLEVGAADISPSD
jgi:protein-tyrosine phosphatase